MARLEFSMSFMVRLIKDNFILTLKSLQLEGIKVAGLSAPVSKLDFCCATTSLAVGNECGLVRNLLLFK